MICGQYSYLKINLKFQSTFFMQYLLKHEKTKPLREVVQNNTVKLVNLAFNKPQPATRPSSPNSLAKLELQFQTIQICSILVKHDDKWLPQNHALVSFLSLSLSLSLLGGRILGSYSWDIIWVWALAGLNKLGYSFRPSRSAAYWWNIMVSGYLRTRLW